MFRLRAPGLRTLLASSLAALAALWLFVPRRVAVGARHEPLLPAALRRLEGARLVTCNTTVGIIQIQVHPEWAPIGAERFLKLVHCGFYDGCAIFRAIPGFLAQFGISPDDGKNRAWRAEGEVQDDPLRPDIPIKTGTMAFAGHGTDSRGTQAFFALKEGTGLGQRPWEVPFAQVEDPASLATLKRIQTKYGDNVDQSKLWKEYGYEYLRTNFPGLTYINSCVVVGGLTAECPAAPLSSLRGLVEAVQRPVGALFGPLAAAISERFRVPVSAEFLALVVVLGVVALFLFLCMVRPTPSPYPGQSRNPYMNPHYQMVRQ